MDIDGQLRRAQDDEREAAAAKARQDADTAAAVAVMQQAFTDFRDALIHHNVPPLPIVRLDREKVPALRRLFSSSSVRLKATPAGEGWRFYGILLFADGSIRGLPAGDAGVGGRIVPGGVGRNWFTESAKEAFARACMGSDFSPDVLYVKEGCGRMVL